MSLFALPLVAALVAALALVVNDPPVHIGRSGQLKVEPPRIEATVTIDGVLDEAPWKSASVLTGFSQFSPNDGIAAADSTVVLVWYSPTAIHFGVRAYEPHGTVRATLAERDRISSDDQIQFLIGTFNDGRQAAVFSVNPLGIQADGSLVEQGNRSSGGLMGGGNSARESADLSQDYVYESKGRLTDFGFEVEVRIPFKSLRFQAAERQTWGLNVVRLVQHSNYEDTWAPAQRANASFLGQSGTLNGLHGLRRGLVLDITPEVTDRMDGTAGATGWDYTAGQPKVGATARWGVTNNLTLNGTVNPDFSQVEADAGQFQFDPRRAVFFAERRPFFIDGIEQFQTPNGLVYTRRIVQPVVSAKISGKVGTTNIAFLSAADAQNTSRTGSDNPIYNIVRLSRDLGAGSRIAMTYTDKLDGAASNRVLSVDGRAVRARIYSGSFQLAGARTQDGGVVTTAPLFEGRLARDGRKFGVRTYFRGIDPDFNTESGFISRTGEVQANLVPRYTWFGERGRRVESFTGSLMGDAIWNYDNFTQRGDARDKKFHMNADATLRGGWTVGASLLLETFGYDPSFYGPRFRIEAPRVGGGFDTLAFTGTPRLPNRDWVLRVGTPRYKYVQANAAVIRGIDENFHEWASADVWYISATINVRASERLRIDGTYQMQDFVRRTDGSLVGIVRIPRIKTEYQISRPFFVRVIGEYYSESVDALRDDSRTGFPLLLRNASGVYVRTAPRNTIRVRGDLLLAYTPSPGTVVYLGYGARMTEPQPFKFDGLYRTDDAFFLKASYLFRMGGLR